MLYTLEFVALPACFGNPDLGQLCRDAFPFAFSSQGSLPWTEVRSLFLFVCFWQRVCVVQAGLELAMQPRLASNLQSSCLGLLSAEIWNHTKQEVKWRRWSFKLVFLHSLELDFYKDFLSLRRLFRRAHVVSEQRNTEGRKSHFQMAPHLVLMQIK
jgi:hypothetical protein